MSGGWGHTERESPLVTLGPGGTRERAEPILLQRAREPASLG